LPGLGRDALAGAGLTSFTALDSAVPALKRATFLAAILISLPVCGLRPVRAERSLTLKVPKPMSCTLSPRAKASESTSNVALSRSAVADLLALALVAMDSMSSALFKMLVHFFGWMVVRRRKDKGKTALFNRNQSRISVKNIGQSIKNVKRQRSIFPDPVITFERRKDYRTRHDKVLEDNKVRLEQSHHQEHRPLNEQFSGDIQNPGQH